MPKYYQKPAGTPSGAKILLIANPTTGYLEKVTLDELSAWINGAVLPSLAAPTGLAAVSFSSSQINLTWNTVVNATGYILESSADGSTGWAAIYTGALLAYSNTGLAASTQRFYRVRATAAGYTTSADSTTANATTGAAAALLPHVSNFTAANSTLLSAYTPDSGGAWTQRAGVFDIQGNQLNNSSNDAAFNCMATFNAGQLTGTIDVIAYENNAYNPDLGIVFNYIDLDNYCWFNFTNGIANIYKRVAGTNSVIVSYGDVGYNDNLEHTFRLIVTSTTVQAFIDTVSIAAPEPLGLTLTGTGFGIKIFDDFDFANNYTINSVNMIS